MSNPSRRSPQLKKLARPIIAAGLIAGGLFQLVSPVLALGTAGGIQILNRATATYEDPDNNVIEAVSNTVTVTVANVAGITSVADKIVDLDDGAVESGDILNYYFDVTNVGNQENRVSVPTTINVTNLDTNGDGSADTTVTATAGGRQIVIVYDANGDGTITGGTGAGGTYAPGDTGAEIWLPVDDGGTIRYSNGTTFFDALDIPADDTFSVIVQAQAPTSGISAGDDLIVSLGTTTPPLGQNVDYVDSTTNDVFTLNTNAAGDTFANVQKEAATSQFIDFASSVNPQAIAAVKKAGVYTPNDVSTYTDDTIAYTLDLEVRNLDPSGLSQPAPLAGTAININGGTATHILVSDLMPVDGDGNRAVLQSLPTGLPAGWTAVYTNDPATVTPTNVEWWTTLGGGGTGQPATAADVTRIGFVYTAGQSLGTNYDTSLQAGSLTFTVVLSGATAATNGLEVYNIAQVLGTTQGDTSGDIVYDESGDNNPNNFNDDGTTPGDPYDPTDTTGDTGQPANEDNGDGTLDPADLDSGNDNTGTDPTPGVPGDGEPNLITAVLATQDDLLIGPENEPEAVGPDGTQNTDFTNKSLAFAPVLDANGNIDIPAGTTITYTNTIKNPATSGFQSNVTVEPADAGLDAPTTGVDLDGDGTLDTVYTNTDIPNGTTVAITFGGNTATYTYNQTTGLWTINAGDIPIIVDTSLTFGEEKSLTVSVTLPAIDNVDPEALPSYPIYLVVFPDDDPTGNAGYTGELTNNITINRLYPAGFMELVKRVRILEADGITEVYPIGGTYADPSADANFPAIEPGQILEYQITYQNISEDGVGGTANLLLPASKFYLEEDGIASVTNVNNWASDNDGNNTPDTLHQNGATANAGTTIYFFPDTAAVAFTGFDFDTPPIGFTTDPADNSIVEGYINSVGTVNPQETGTFTFQRVLQ